jgi:hypothetical protein
MMSRTLLLLSSVLAACTGGSSRDSLARDSADSTFGLVQSRGHAAMGVDQYTSTHRFEPLPDGGRITLQRDANDSAGTAQIRSHMMMIARAFQRGDFAVPGFVHDRAVPGTAVMAQRRARISYTTDTLSRGAELRIHSDDTTAVNAIHQFLAFQRQDHRAGGSGAGH